MYSSPVLALQFNILSAFENAAPDFRRRLEAAIAARRFSPEIDIDLQLAPPRPPFLRQDKGEAAPSIHLHVPYLELLWAFTYGWMILYEEGVQKPWMRGESPLHVDQDTPLLARAHELLAWARSLRQLYTPWPSPLRSPEHHESDAERTYGGRANLVFQEAASFLLLHEFVHAERQHLDIRETRPSDDVILDLEKDADNGAFEVFIRPDSDDDEKLSKSWAIAAAMLCSFYLKFGETVDEVRTHFPLHHRLEHILRNLNLQQEGPRGYFEYLASIILRDTFPEKLAQSPTIFDTAADALKDKLDRLDGIGQDAE